MNQLVLHAQTQQLLAQYGAHPPHALLLLGSDGVGKGTLARKLVEQLLELAPGEADQSPSCTILLPDEKTNSLPIDAIRKLQQFVKLRTVGTKQIRRAIIIEHANTLTTEAQNALLKLLEEPPADTILVLTTSELQTLLPTIQSRVQTLPVIRPERAALEKFFQTNYTPTDVAQAFFLSGGLPGLMAALLSDSKHPLLASVQQAKQLLQQDAFTRLAHMDTVAKQKNDALQLCVALQRMSQAALEQAATKKSDAGVARWHAIHKAAHRAEGQLLHNASTKLTMTQLLLQLSA